VFGVGAGLTYPVVSALLLGVYTVLVKRYVAHYPPTVYVTLTYACSLGWYLPLAAVTVDGRYLPAGAGGATVAVFAVVVGGYALAVLAFFRAVAVGEVSYVAPIAKLVPVFVVPVEVLALGQYLSPVQLGGIAVATAAVYVANYQPGAGLEPLVRAVRSRPAQFALASAAVFGVTDVGKRVLTQELAVPPETVNLGLFVGLPIALAPLAARRLPQGVRGDARLFAGLGLVLAAAEHFVMLSFAALPASLASPVINTSAVVTVVLGGVVLGEEAIRVRLTAAGLAVLGVGLVSFG